MTLFRGRFSVKSWHGIDRSLLIGWPCRTGGTGKSYSIKSISDTGCIRLRMFHTRVFAKDAVRTALSLHQFAREHPWPCACFFFLHRRKLSMNTGCVSSKKSVLGEGISKKSRKPYQDFCTKWGNEIKKWTVVKNVAVDSRTILGAVGWQKRCFYPYLKWGDFFCFVKKLENVLWKTLKKRCVLRYLARGALRKKECLLSERYGRTEEIFLSQGGDFEVSRRFYLLRGQWKAGKKRSILCIRWGKPIENWINRMRNAETCRAIFCRFGCKNGSFYLYLI